MFGTVYRRLNRGTTRRAVTVAMLVSYAFTAGGIPLPAAALNPALAGGKGPAGAFPCADSTCGCNSAETCWRSCCCHSLAERLTWAQEHGVQPPDFALELARKAGLLDGSSFEPAHSEAKHSCCSEHGSIDALSADKTVRVHVVLETPSQVNQRASRTVIAWHALACHGQSLNWLAAIPAVEIVPSDLVSYHSPADWLGPLTSDSILGLTFDLVTPPPELG